MYIEGSSNFSCLRDDFELLSIILHVVEMLGMILRLELEMQTPERRHFYRFGPVSSPECCGLSNRVHRLQPKHNPCTLTPNDRIPSRLWINLVKVRVAGEVFGRPNVRILVVDSVLFCPSSVRVHALDN